MYLYYLHKNLCKLKITIMVKYYSSAKLNECYVIVKFWERIARMHKYPPLQNKLLNIRFRYCHARDIQFKHIKNIVFRYNVCPW